MARTAEAHFIRGFPKKNDRKQMFATRIDIEESDRKKIIEILNARLADTLDVQTQAKFAHWNVKGNDFYQVHLLFDEVAEHLEDAVDLIAERATALGGKANGTVRQSAANSTIDEYELDTVKGMDHVRVLSDRVGALANTYREAVNKTDDLGDPATSDMFTEILRQAEQDLYFLESHIQA